MTHDNLASFTNPNVISLIFANYYALQLDWVIAVIVELKIFLAIGTSSINLVDNELGVVARLVAHSVIFLNSACETCFVSNSYCVVNLGAVFLCRNSGGVCLTVANHFYIFNEITINWIAHNGFCNFQKSTNLGGYNHVIKWSGSIGSNRNGLDGVRTLIYFILNACCHRECCDNECEC